MSCILAMTCLQIPWQTLMPAVTSRRAFIKVFSGTRLQLIANTQGVLSIAVQTSDNRKPSEHCTASFQHSQCAQQMAQLMHLLQPEQLASIFWKYRSSCLQLSSVTSSILSARQRSTVPPQALSLSSGSAQASRHMVCRSD